jgi:hypothetical protein
MDKPDVLTELLKKSGYSDDYGELTTCRQKMGNTVQNRVNHLLEQNRHSIKGASEQVEFQPKSLEPGQAAELIPTIGNEIVELHSMDQGAQRRSTMQDLRHALWDLEVILGKYEFTDSPVDGGEN